MRANARRESGEYAFQTARPENARRRVGVQTVRVLKSVGGASAAPQIANDAMHRVLGLEGCAYQSLYHFTIGGPIEDERLTTLPPYPPERAAQ